MRFLPAALAAVTLLLPAVAPAGTSSPDLDGPFLFVDKKSFDHMTSLANIDQAFGEYCISGQLKYQDATTTLNRQVRVLYDALGSISKSSASKVVGDFSGVVVNFRVIVFDGTTPLADILFDSGTVMPPCSLKSQVKKSGEMDGVSLVCDLGPDLVGLGSPSGDVVDSIGYALGDKNTVKLDTKSGAFKLSHKGVPMPEGLNSPLACPTTSDAPVEEPE